MFPLAPPLKIVFQTAFENSVSLNLVLRGEASESGCVAGLAATTETFAIGLATSRGQICSCEENSFSLQLFEKPEGEDFAEIQSNFNFNELLIIA